LLVAVLLLIATAYVWFAPGAGEHPLRSYGFPFDLLPRSLAGTLGVVFCSATAWRAYVGLVLKRPRLEISSEGILTGVAGDRGHLIPWSDVVDMRRRRSGIDVVLRESASGLDVAPSGIVAASAQHLDRVFRLSSPEARALP